jgi:hypothetical protein
LLCTADSKGERRVDPWIGGKLGREVVAAGGAGLLALGHPLVEAAEAEVVLARRLR